jgi:ATP-dependent Clp protease ATP-binding subunit ClpA
MILDTLQAISQSGKKIDILEETKEFLLAKIETSGNHARGIQKIYREHLEVPLAKFMLKNKKDEIVAKITDSVVTFE